MCTYKTEAATFFIYVFLFFFFFCGRCSTMYTRAFARVRFVCVEDVMFFSASVWGGEESASQSEGETWTRAQ